MSHTQPAGGLLRAMAFATPVSLALWAGILMLVSAAVGHGATRVSGPLYSAVSSDARFDSGCVVLHASVKGESPSRVSMV